MKRKVKIDLSIFQDLAITSYNPFSTVGNRITFHRNLLRELGYNFIIKLCKEAK
ncbi:MAG: hypothetical protein AB7V50_03130 [Vampirovibrionia bacterium]